MSDHVYWMLELAIKDGQLETFKALMEEMVESTKANEPGALNYEWWINEAGTVCHLYERYADSAATLAHLGAFGANYAERFMACVDMKRFVPTATLMRSAWCIARYGRENHVSAWWFYTVKKLMSWMLRKSMNCNL